VDGQRRPSLSTVVDLRVCGISVLPVPRGMGALGFRFHAGLGPALGVVGVAVLIGFTFSWINALIGLVVADAESAGLAGLFPVIALVFTGSTFVPTATMPGWLEAFAEITPSPSPSTHSAHSPSAGRQPTRLASRRLDRRTGRHHHPHRSTSLPPSKHCMTGQLAPTATSDQTSYSASPHLTSRAAVHPATAGAWSTAPRRAPDCRGSPDPSGRRSDCTSRPMFRGTCPERRSRHPSTSALAWPGADACARGVRRSAPASPRCRSPDT